MTDVILNNRGEVELVLGDTPQEQAVEACHTCINNHHCEGCFFGPHSDEICTPLEDFDF